MPDRHWLMTIGTFDRPISQSCHWPTQSPTNRQIAAKSSVKCFQQTNGRQLVSAAKMPFVQFTFGKSIRDGVVVIHACGHLTRTSMERWNHFRMPLWRLQKNHLCFRCLFALQSPPNSRIVWQKFKNKNGYSNRSRLCLVDYQTN